MQNKATATQIKTILFPPEADRAVLEGEDMEARHGEVRSFIFSRHCSIEHMKMNVIATYSTIDVDLHSCGQTLRFLCCVISTKIKNGTSHESGTNKVMNLGGPTRTYHIKRMRV